MSRITGILLAFALLCASGVAAEGRGTAVARYDAGQTPVVASKGTWVVGGQAMFSAHENSNYSFAFVQGVNSNGCRLAAEPEFGFFVKDNMAIGAKLSYGRTMLSVADGKAAISSFEAGVRNYYTESRDAAFTAFMRYYIPIIESGRLSFHVDAGIRGLYGQGKRSDESKGDPVGTWESRWSAAVVVNPGVTVFIGRSVALVASLGLAGLSYGNVDQVHNQVSEGNINAFKANFMLDPTELSIGMDFYFGKR